MLEKSLVERIQEEYESDFGLQIKVLCNDEREDIQPIPLAMYEVESEQGKDKGIITMAEIVNDVDVEKFCGTKHTELRWISEDEVESFSEPAVADFKNTLKMVFKRLKEEK